MMRALWILSVALAGCGDTEEAAFAPNAVRGTSADESKALNEAEAMLDNRMLAPADPALGTNVNPPEKSPPDRAPEEARNQ